MPRRKRKAEELARIREHILEAAARAFTSVGYQAATMATIARQAGYTAPTLYTYFPGKRDILENLITLVLSEHRAVYRKRMPAGLNFEQKLDLLLHRHFELLARRQDIVAFLMSLHWPTVGIPPYRGRPARESIEEVLLDKPRSWLAKNTRGSEFEGVDPGLLAPLLNAITTALVDRWLRDDRSETATELAQLAHKLFLGAASTLLNSPERG